MRRIALQAPRGQTLVLFALMLLVLTIMVLGTVGIGVRAKQRVELQIATDAAAYSEAVATARTFNMIAVMNRAQVSYMVVMAGNQSLISHASQHYDALKGQIAADGGTVCSGHGGIQYPSGIDATTLDTKWAQADQAAAFGTAGLQGTAGSVYPAELALYTKLVSQDLVNQGMAQAIFAKAFPGQSEIVVPPTGAAKSMMEITGSTSNTVPTQSDLEQQAVQTGGAAVCGGAVCLRRGDSKHELLETYGSEGWTWVRDRQAGGGETRGASEFDFNPSTAGNLFFPSIGQFDPIDTSDNGVTSSAHDHAGAVSVTCVDGTTDMAQTGDTWVNSTEQQDHYDQHMYFGTDWNDTMVEPNETQPEYQLHTLGPCLVCHGIWPAFVDWSVDAMDQANNDYGQPKLYAVAYRDFTLAPTQPWNLSFTFHFANPGSGQLFNAGSQEEAQAAGTGLSRQGALSAAIVYYHRPYGTSYPDGWQEPPNFVNPFWRATLVSPEGAGDDDPAATLTAVGLGQQAGALNALESVGFQGVHP